MTSEAENQNPAPRSENAQPGLKISEMTPTQILELSHIPLSDGRLISVHLLNRLLMPSFMMSLFYTGQVGVEAPYEFTSKAARLGGGGKADCGYLGIGQDFRDVVGAQASVLKQIGLSNKDILSALQPMYQSLGIPLAGIDANYEGANIRAEDISTVKGRKVSIANRSLQIISPLGTPIVDNDIYIEDAEGLKVLVSAMHPSFIAEYGFYESGKAPIPNNYAIFPKLIKVLGLYNGSLDELKQLYFVELGKFEEARKRYRSFYEEHISKKIPSYILNDRLKLNLRTTAGWRTLAEHYRNETYPAAKEHARSFEDALSYCTRQGIDLGDAFVSYYLDKYGHLPGETDEEKRAIYWKEQLDIVS